MAKKRKRTSRARKAGLPPGSVVFLGEQKVDSVRIHCIRYGKDECDELDVQSVAEAVDLIQPGSTTWIDVVGLHEVSVIAEFGDRLDLHPLVREDIVSTGQRPKVESFDKYLYVVAKMLALSDGESLSAEQVSIVFGEGFVLSFQEREGDVFEAVRNRIREGKGRIRSLGPDYLSYALLDSIVDHYFISIGAIGDALDDLEDLLLDDPKPEYQGRLRALRKELILVRHAVWPVREMLNKLERNESPLVAAVTRPFLRDVHDHAVQILDIIESMRDAVSGLMDLYLSSLSNRMNEIMKVLTIFGSIFLPLSFVVGLYGMNFDNMPELHYKYGYPTLVAFMIGVAVSLLVYFKRKNWL